jgi:hypothetical protein
MDFRSPTLGIRRTPLAEAKPWSYATREPIVFNLKVEEEPAEKEKEEEVVEVSKMVPIPSTPTAPSLEEEMSKLRLEFSAKKNFVASESKKFLSSPALWRTIAASPQCNKESPHHVASDPLLQDWQSPARRSLFTRSDSASAA